MSDLRDELALLRDLGYTHLDFHGQPRAASSERAAEPSPVSTRPARTSATPQPAPATQYREAGPPATSEITGSDELSQLALIAKPCTRCQLAKWRTQVVFGSGNPSADLMFVGEAPGRDEDV